MKTISPVRGLWLAAVLPALVLGLSAMAVSPAHAQTQQAPASQVDPNTMLNSGLQVAQMIDADRIDDLWRGASSTTQRVSSKNEFAKSLKTSRAPLGKAGARQWLSAQRQQVRDKNAPGEYISLKYATRFANRQAVELVTFRLDEDGIWRWAGYVVR